MEPAEPVLVKLPNGGYANRYPDGSLREVKKYGGSPGISQAQLKAKSESGVSVPVSQTTATRGGFEPNQEYIEGLSDISINKKLQAQKALDTGLEAAEIEREAATANLAAKTAGEEERQRFAAEEQQLYKQQLAKRDDARRRYQQAGVDPDRIFAGEAGTLKRIGGAIFAAMGQWGAMVAGGQNTAMQTIQAEIDRNIDAQKAEIAKLGDQSQNAMSDLMQQGMSMRQAEAALKEAQYERTAAHARWTQANALPGQLQQNFDALLTSLDEATLREREAYDRESQGETTRQMSERYEYARRGSPGGIRETGALITQEDKARDERPVETSAVGAVTEHIKAWNSFNRLSQNPILGEAEGKFLDVTGGIGRAMTGNVPAALGGENAQDFDQDLAVGLQANRKAVTGAGASVEELARLKSDWVGQGSQREIARKTEQGKQEAVDGLKQRLAGMTTGQRQRLFEQMPAELQAEVLKKE
jgi:hypothetical protein